VDDGCGHRGLPSRYRPRPIAILPPGIARNIHRPSESPALYQRSGLHLRRRLGNLLLGTRSGFWQLRAMAVVTNALIGLMLAGTSLGGFALFWIARQDDSRAGRLLGLLAILLSVLALIWLSAGHHWL